MVWNEKEKRARFEALDKRRRELNTELENIADEMIQIWKEYANFLESVPS